MDELLRGLAAATASSGHTERHRDVVERGRTSGHRGTDLSISDCVADADVHGRSDLAMTSAIEDARRPQVRRRLLCAAFEGRKRTHDEADHHSRLQTAAQPVLGVPVRGSGHRAFRAQFLWAKAGPRTNDNENLSQMQMVLIYIRMTQINTL